MLTLDPNAEIVPSVDPRHGQSQQPSDSESETAKAARVQAYLSFIAELEAVTPGVIISEDVDSAGNSWLIDAFSHSLSFTVLTPFNFFFLFPVVEFVSCNELMSYCFNC